MLLHLPAECRTLCPVTAVLGKCVPIPLPGLPVVPVPAPAGREFCVAVRQSRSRFTMTDVPSGSRVGRGWAGPAGRVLVGRVSPLTGSSMIAAPRRAHLGTHVHAHALPAWRRGGHPRCHRCHPFLGRTDWTQHNKVHYGRVWGVMPLPLTPIKNTLRAQAD